MKKQRRIDWRPLEYSGVECLTLTDAGSVFLVIGEFLDLLDDAPFEFTYRLTIDKNFCVKSLVLNIRDAERMVLKHDDQGHWANVMNNEHIPLPEFGGGMVRKC